MQTRFVALAQGGTLLGGGKQIWSVCSILFRLFSKYCEATLICLTKNVAGERGLHSQYAPNPCQSMIEVDFSAMGRLRLATVLVTFQNNTQIM